MYVLGKGKDFLVTCDEDREGGRYAAPVISNLGARGWWMFKAKPWQLYTPDSVPGPFVHEGVWASRPVWRDVEKKKSLDPTGIQTLNRLCRSDLLYVLRRTFPQATIKRCISYRQEKASGIILEGIWTYNLRSIRGRNSADRRKDETK